MYKTLDNGYVIFNGIGYNLSLLSSDIILLKKYDFVKWDDNLIWEQNIKNNIDAYDEKTGITLLMLCIPNYTEMVPWLLEYGSDPNSYFKVSSGYKMYVMEHALCEYLYKGGPRALYCVKLLAKKKAYFDSWENLKKIINYNNYDEIVSILMNFLPLELCKKIVYEYKDYKILLPRFNTALNTLKENGYNLSHINII